MSSSSSSSSSAHTGFIQKKQYPSLIQQQQQQQQAPVGGSSLKVPLPQQKVTVLPHHAKLQQQLHAQQPPFLNPPIINNHTGPRTKGQGEHNPIYGSPVVVVTPPGVKSNNTLPSPPPPPQINGKTPLPSPSAAKKPIEDAEEEVDPSLLVSSPAANSLNEDVSGSESEAEDMEIEKEEEKPITHPPPPPAPIADDDEGKKGKKKKETSSVHRAPAKSSRRGVAPSKTVEDEGEEGEKPKKGRGGGGGKKKTEEKPAAKVPTAEEVALAMLAIKEKEKKEEEKNTKKFSNPSVSSLRPSATPQNLKRLSPEEAAGLSFSSYLTEGEDGRLNLNSFRMRSKPSKLSEIPANNEVTFVNWYLRRGIFGPYYVLVSDEGKEYYSDEPTYFALEDGRPDGYLPGKVLFHVKNVPCWGIQYSFSLVKKNNQN